MKNLYKIGDIIYFYNKYTKEIFSGKIVGTRFSHLNWDYQIRYNIHYNDVFIWIEQKYINKSCKDLQVNYLK